MRFLGPILACMDNLIFSVEPLILYLRLKFRRS
jgi:hypothetical protein